MPLGQAPFGSRQTPRDEEPPEDPRGRGDRLVSQGRWIFFVGTAAILAFLVARGTGTRSSDRKEGGFARAGPCLTDRSCAQGWRCYVVPKDDPFAVEGECAQVCEGDLQCPSQHRCETVFDAEKGPLVVPKGARGATGKSTGVCRPCGPQGCEAQL